MSDWAATERVAAEVVLADGTVLQGDLHLQARVAHREGPETPLELLNRPEPFFALSQGDGVAFVSKAQVASVSCGPQSPLADPERFGAAKLVELEAVLPGGETFRGWASLELPPTRGRALDYLNGPDRFFTVWTHAVTRYLNRAHVRLVRPLD